MYFHHWLSKQFFTYSSTRTITLSIPLLLSSGGNSRSYCLGTWWLYCSVTQNRNSTLSSMDKIVHVHSIVNSDVQFSAGLCLFHHKNKHHQLLDWLMNYFQHFCLFERKRLIWWFFSLKHINRACSLRVILVLLLRQSDIFFR